MSNEQLTAEILVVGNELLNGTTLDTNSFWLSQKLNESGVCVLRKTTIRDNLEAISLGFHEALMRKPDWLFSIGGLGPTFDDLTIRGLGKGTHRRLALNPEAVTMLRVDYRKRRKRISKLSKTSLKMAMIPNGGVPLRNPVGSAPAVLIKQDKTTVVTLPGVPNEMKQIFLTHVVSKLREASCYSIKERWVKIIGLPESRLAPEISRQFETHKRYLYVKSHPSGFQKGKPVLNIQIILDAPKSELDEGTKTLNAVSSSVMNYARRLGANVLEIRSV